VHPQTGRRLDQLQLTRSFLEPLDVLVEGGTILAELHVTLNATLVLRCVTVNPL
jgi:hypothetical protein